MVSASITVSTSYAIRNTDIAGMRTNEENQTSERKEIPGNTFSEAGYTI